LYETPVHREQSATQTGKARRRLARAWRAETAFDLSEPKRIPPIADCRMVAFKYFPVGNTRTIRLLELFQETDGFNSPIMCAIGHFSLDDEKVQYRALSYFWGANTKTHTIYINGKRSDVTANLYSALLRLRTNYFCCCKLVCSCARSSQHPETLDEHFTSPQPPWIDALCLYFDRYRIEYLRNLRFGPLVFRGVSPCASRFNQAVCERHRTWGDVA
jgi:hypothetical protein